MKACFNSSFLFALTFYLATNITCATALPKGEGQNVALRSPGEAGNIIFPPDVAHASCHSVDDVVNKTPISRGDMHTNVGAVAGAGDTPTTEDTAASPNPACQTICVPCASTSSGCRPLCGKVC